MSGKILLVEDDPDSCIIVRTYLEHVGFAVLEAHDGEEAVRRAREDEPDLVLMDVSIPRIDGWEATRILKGDPRTAGIPVVALTAQALRIAQERAREAGCDGYLAKPVEPRRVAEEIRRWLGAEPAGATPDVIS